jgi:hypothetical protein
MENAPLLCPWVEILIHWALGSYSLVSFFLSDLWWLEEFMWYSLGHTSLSSLLLWSQEVQQLDEPLWCVLGASANGGGWRSSLGVLEKWTTLCLLIRQSWRGDSPNLVIHLRQIYASLFVFLFLHPVTRPVDEDTTSTSTPAAPSPTPAPAAPSSAPPSGPITRARAREFNFIMMLKNEGPKDWRLAQQEALCMGA